MTAKLKWTNFLFCFHPKFDTGTWTIASALTTLVLFAAMFAIVIGYAVPTCVCDEFYDHLTILPTVPKAVYVAAIIFILLLLISCFLVIYGTFKAQPGKFPLYIILMVFTNIGFFVASIYAFILLSKFEEYLLFDNETYINMARLVVKEEIFAKLEGLLEHVSFFAKEFLDISLDEALNVDNLMDAALKEEVITVLGGMKQMMKVSVVLILVGFNTFLTTSILVASSHYYRLKRGIVRSYTGVPAMVIHRAVMSDSVKSDSLSDLSRTPMNNLPRSNGTRSSARNSNRIYAELSRNGSTIPRKDGLYPQHSTRNSRVTYTESIASGPVKSKKRELV